MAKRLILSGLAWVGITLLLGIVAGIIAAVLVYSYLYNKEIELYEKAMHEVEYDCVKRPTRPIQFDPEVAVPRER